MSLLKLEKVSKSYTRGGLFGRGEGVTALDNVSLIIGEGESFGIIGRSGAGKSSLGRLVLGLERPDSGVIRYRGKDFRMFTRKDWQHYRREVQVVFQNALGSVNPRWQVRDIIAEPMRNSLTLSRSALHSRIDELLQLVGLDPEDREKYPHQFSGGQLQRICIARALSVEPKLIVLDEAVSSLDMLIQAQILELLRTLQHDTGVSYFFVSHDIRIVAGFCDEVAVINKGRLTSCVRELRDATTAADPVLRQLAASVLPAWPKQTFN